MASHSILAPSAAHRWSKCPASVVFASLLSDEGGRDATEGTLAHELAASLLMSPASRRRRLDAGQSIPRSPGAIRKALSDGGSDAEGVEADIGEYLDFCRTLPSLDVERVIPLDGVLDEPGCFGTADAVSDTAEGLWIVDLKTGRKPVAAKENSQLILYAAGLLAAAKSKHLKRAASFPVRLVIVQPRLYALEVWETPAKDISRRAAALALAGKRALDLVAGSPLVAEDFRAGRHCLHCTAAATCRALADYAQKGIPILRSEEEAAARLTTAELAEAWRRLPAVQAWADAVAKEALSRLSAGVRLPGLHLGTGRPGGRRWADAAAAERWAVEVLGDEAFEPRALRSPAQMEKALKKAPPEVKKVLDTLVLRPVGAPKVVEGDPEPDAVQSVSPFEDVSSAGAVPAAGKEAGGENTESTENTEMRS